MPSSSSPSNAENKARPGSAARVPVAAYSDQENVFAAAFDVLKKAVAERTFPAASLAVTQDGKLVALRAFGHFTYEPDSPDATETSIFDLASVSKVVATTSMAMILYERGLLDLDAPAVAIVPEFAGYGLPGEDPRRREITLRMLLAHSSGLPAYEKLFLRAKTRDELLTAAFAIPLTADPGTRAEYSDIGFILLGVALERIADETLDRFCQREVFGPLGMTRTLFNPSAARRSAIVPTEDDRSFRKRVIQGEVQDENASVMGGVAGHAGVFSSAGDLAIFAHAMLPEAQPLVRPETLSVFAGREASVTGSSRALGWDTPSAPSQSGQHFSPKSFGHLGYTGTSMWIDPERQLSVVLLTNRTWPDCENQAIKEVRPRFHDALIEGLRAKA